jgi:hypothetical protein
VLTRRGVKLLVIACNTASAVALDHLAEVFAPLPVVGVVEPGATAACEASRSGQIVVIATEGTVRGGAYERAIRARRPDAVVLQVPCSLFVALAEEGWVAGPIAEAIAHRYLDAPLAELPGADCLVLGCTHFPVLRAAISAAVGPRITLIDSAETTARRGRPEARGPRAGPVAGSGKRPGRSSVDPLPRNGRAGTLCPGRRRILRCGARESFFRRIGFGRRIGSAGPSRRRTGRPVNAASPMRFGGSDRSEVDVHRF